MAIREAVDLHQQLAADQPAAFNPDFANSLNNLSLDLSALGHQEEALTAIQESVELYRQLAADQPAALNPDLARSLHNFSHHLSDLGHREEAMQATQEAHAYAGEQ
jgi:tetratricopeptide (TPR) repeat protein